MGGWAPGFWEKGADQQGCYSIVIPNRALEQTLVKMPGPWAGLAPCPLPPQQTPEPAYPASPAFPPLSCPFASRVVYQDGFYGAEIYVSVALGREGCRSNTLVPGRNLSALRASLSLPSGLSAERQCTQTMAIVNGSPSSPVSPMRPAPCGRGLYGGH